MLTEDERMELVKEYYLGRNVSQHSLAKQHGISQSTVSAIIVKFAAENDKSALLMRRHATGSQTEELQVLRKVVST